MTNLPTPTHSGKVRDTYDCGNDDELLLVATDRLSAFDVVMNELVPGKGKVLAALTKFWLTGLLRDIPNHFISTDMRQVPAHLRYIPDLAGRGMLVRRARILPLEFIIRAYLYGSGLKDYQREDGVVCGIQLPSGLVKASRLPEVILTPSTKAEVGHDENIDAAEARQILADRGFDPRLYDQAVAMAMEVFARGSTYAAERGVIIADTKFEFGLVDGELMLCDEVLTPDSSRFWDLESWQPGEEPRSYDKQPVRDYLATQHPDWNKQYPPPPLPTQVVSATASRYNLLQDIMVGT